MVPIVMVVALGAYGESLGGSTTVDGPGSASLSVQPSLVTLGQPVSISGPGDGGLFIVVPGALEIVSARSDDLQVASVVPTLEPLYWVWTAPGEPFVYAGRLDPDAVINLHRLDADSLLLTGRLDLPYGMPLAS